MALGLAAEGAEMAATLSSSVAALCYPSTSKICRAPFFLPHNHNHSVLLQLPMMLIRLAFATLAISVKYRDPLRSFVGVDKYKRPLWARDTLNNPSVSVQEMVMLSTSVLCIKWTIKGKPKSLIGRIAGVLILRVTSRFTLNQISGQVIEHEESWDLSNSSAVAQAFFWTSRALFAALESGKDLVDIAKDVSGRLPTKKDNLEIDPDPSPDPTKFFQRDDSFQRDAYQIALFLTVLYFLVQFLTTVL
ncbi:hypothetical protein K1719_040103 [Acacia pycnantha]|nr:hypothetical protein K1719_040103 [Acacia pycnantha]